MAFLSAGAIPCVKLLASGLLVRLITLLFLFETVFQVRLGSIKLVSSRPTVLIMPEDTDPMPSTNGLPQQILQDAVAFCLLLDTRVEEELRVQVQIRL
ncbi:hypothetical protein V6N11_053732 [Hibiscus sabdariffa]|uniref:Uncharacterized protein n=1 Tax=Hibiscus sabdariffa TaxID=183260 RepID=A0ABR2S2I4_9ROSI